MHSLRWYFLCPSTSLHDILNVSITGCLLLCAMSSLFCVPDDIYSTKKLFLRARPNSRLGFLHEVYFESQSFACWFCQVLQFKLSLGTPSWLSAATSSPHLILTACWTLELLNLAVSWHFFSLLSCKFFCNICVNTFRDISQNVTSTQLSVFVSFPSFSICRLWSWKHGIFNRWTNNWTCCLVFACISRLFL